MIRYNKFCKDGYSTVNLELREVAISMYVDITEVLLEGTWNARQLCSKWIDVWENVLYCIQTNDNIAENEYSDCVTFANRRIIELCNTFNCKDLYQKYLVD